MGEKGEAEKAEREMRAEGEGGQVRAPRELVCPRCGQRASYIERQVKGSQVYFLAVHYLGYDSSTKRKRVRKCYLGPKEYVNVEKLHGLGLAGLIDRARFKRYLREVVESTDFGLEELLELISDLARRVLEEADLLEPSEAERALPKAYVTRELLSKLYGKLYEKRLLARFSRP